MKKIDVRKIDGRKNPADLNTKYHPPARHEELLRMHGIGPHDVAGEIGMIFSESDEEEMDMEEEHQAQREVEFFLEVMSFLSRTPI